MSHCLVPEPGARLVLKQVIINHSYFTPRPVLKDVEVDRFYKRDNLNNFYFTPGAWPILKEIIINHFCFT